MRTLALCQILYIAWPTFDSRTGCHYQTPTVLGLQNDIICSSTQSAEYCGLWSALLAQPLSTLWSIILQPQGTSSVVPLKGMVPEYRSPRYGPAMGCKSIWALLETPCANQHVAGTACTAVRNLRNLPLWLANNILHEWPSMRELGHRCDSRISLHGVLP